MRFLALADIHSEEYVIDRVRVASARGSYDGLLLVGDITNRGPVSFLEELVGQFDMVYAVHGNMDSKEVEERLKELGVSVHLKRVEVGAYNIVGYGGSNPTPFKTPIEYSEEQIYQELSKMKIDQATILLSHAPPKGIFDSVGELHPGSDAIRRIIEEKKPLASVHGHIHEHEGTQMLGPTHVVKLASATHGNAGVITLMENKVHVEFIKL